MEKERKGGGVSEFKNWGGGAGGGAEGGREPGRAGARRRRRCYIPHHDRPEV